MYEIVEHTDSLLRLRHADDYGWMLLVFFVGYGLWGGWYQWRKARREGRRDRVLPAVMLLAPVAIGLVTLYFLAPTTALVLNRPTDSGQLVRRTAYGNAVRVERFALSKVRDVQVVAQRRSRGATVYFLELVLDDGRPVALDDEVATDAEDVRPDAEVVRAFLGGRRAPAEAAPLSTDLR